MVRRVMAVLLGLMVGSATVWLAQRLGQLAYPPPPPVDPDDVEGMRRMLAGLPVVAFVVMLAAWALGALTGGYVAARLAPAEKVGHALVVGALQLAAGSATVLMIPGHPAWFVALGLLLFLPMAWLGGRFAARRKLPELRSPENESAAGT